MTRWLVVGGLSAALVGAALILPAVVGGFVEDSLSALTLVVISVGGVLIMCGAAAIVVGIRQRRPLAMPGGVRTAVVANALFLAFFALEISDGLTRRGGQSTW
jgi:hypothetical protein